MSKTILYLLALLLIPFIILLSPFICLYLIVDRYFEYREKLKGLTTTKTKKVISVNNWVNDNK